MPVTTSNQLINIPDFALSFGVKAILLSIIFIYAVFAILLIRQVRLMEKAINTPLSSVISAIAILHAMATVAVLIAVIFFL